MDMTEAVEIEIYNNYLESLLSKLSQTIARLRGVYEKYKDNILELNRNIGRGKFLDEGQGSEFESKQTSITNYSKLLC